MKYYISHEGWFFKDYYGDLERALWIKDIADAQAYDDFNEANKAASELQVLLEISVQLVRM